MCAVRAPIHEKKIIRRQEIDPVAAQTLDERNTLGRETKRTQTTTHVGARGGGSNSTPSKRGASTLPEPPLSPGRKTVDVLPWIEMVSLRQRDSVVWRAILLAIIAEP